MARRGTIRRGVPALVALSALLAACSLTPAPVEESREAAPPPSSRSTQPRSTDSPSVAAARTPSPTPTPGPTRSPSPRVAARFDAGAAMADVRLLAGQIGPRLATGPAYREAARVVERRLRRLGYDVRRQRFPVPAGDSWGVPVEAGTSFNVIASPPGFDPAAPHLIVGAHLDTVAVAPGAEDNASGVAVVLEAARLAADNETRLPTVFIAFGAEEPRGPRDDQHHFGSQHYVREMPQAQRRALRAMVAADRVGVGDHVPVCTGPLSPHRVRDGILTTARRVDIPAGPCELTTSDHWSFEKAGFTVARLGSIEYPEYHSAQDLPRVVDREQLQRSGTVLWSWLRDTDAGSGS